MTNLKKVNRERFQQQLLSWYKENKRDLPWRKTKDPYRIWVSEIMLQQTRVDTVIPYYENFLKQFPTIAALAEADEEAVLKAWEGLGYYSRARNLQRAAREVQATYGGVVPNNEEDIMTLKGIGPYTAGAILSIAYGKPVPAVDGNVMRVLARILHVRANITQAKTRKVFEQAVRELIHEGEAADFNQALMELGALICTPTSPGCLLCPVRDHCQAFHEGVQEELPIRTKKRPPRQVPIAVAVVQNQKGDFLISKRPNEGLLANLWEFPNCEIDAKGKKREALHTLFREAFGVHVELETDCYEFKHIFTHLTWELTVFRGTLHSDMIETATTKFIKREQFSQYPFSVAHQKIIGRLSE